jgi:hypothetical protein
MRPPGRVRSHRFKRGDQVKRQWRILLALSDRDWFTLREIFDDLPRVNRHRRTNLLDLEILSDVFPIQRREWRDEESGLWEYQLRLRWPLENLLRK